jgi:hypothetical protein
MSDLFAELQDRVQRQLSRTADALRAGAQYAASRGDVMLRALMLRHSSDVRALRLALRCRERPIYVQATGARVDIAEHSGLHVPELQEIADLTIEDLPGPARRFVRFGRRSFVERDALLTAIVLLFSQVASYETARIDYPLAYDGHGISRNALVSVSGLSVLGGFDVPELHAFPDVYHSSEPMPRRYLRFSSGTTVAVPSGFALSESR